MLRLRNISYSERMGRRHHPLISSEVFKGAELTYTDTGVSSRTTYSYRIRAIATATSVSGWSDNVTATTEASAEPEAPTLTATVDSHTEIDAVHGRLQMRGRVERSRSTYWSEPIRRIRLKVTIQRYIWARL